MALQDFNLKDFLCIPVIATPEQTQEEWDAEVSRMLWRHQMTDQFLAGQITPDDYECGLAETGVNPYEAWEAWEQGLTFF